MKMAWPTVFMISNRPASVPVSTWRNCTLPSRITYPHQYPVGLESKLHNIKTDLILRAWRGQLNARTPVQLPRTFLVTFAAMTDVSMLNYLEFERPIAELEARIGNCVEQP